jgi:hypothetical protein
VHVAEAQTEQKVLDRRLPTLLPVPVIVELGHMDSHPEPGLRRSRRNARLRGRGLRRLVLLLFGDDLPDQFARQANGLLGTGRSRPRLDQRRTDRVVLDQESNLVQDLQGGRLETVEIGL